VHLSVPELSVKRIELDVNNLSANINLNAQVANLVTVNAGIAVSIRKVNLTITDVGAELELNVRLGHLVDIVNRVFQSLDLNPLLITAINNVTTILETTVAAVDGLLGSVAQGTSTLNFLIDNLGNIVQQVVGVAGQAVNTIVGDYSSNMTYTGKQQTLQNGLIQKTYSYGPLNALVNIVFNSNNQIVSATVVKQDKPGSKGSAPKGGAPQGGAPQGGAPQGGAPQGGASGGPPLRDNGGAGGGKRPPVAISSSIGFSMG